MAQTEFLKWLESASYTQLVDIAHYLAHTCEICGVCEYVSSGRTFPLHYQWRHHKDCPNLVVSAIQTSTRWR